MSGIIFFEDGPLEGTSMNRPEFAFDGSLVYYPRREGAVNKVYTYRLTKTGSGAFEARLEEGDPIE